MSKKDIDVVKEIVDAAGLDPTILEEIIKTPDFLPVSSTPKVPSVRKFKEDISQTDLENDYQKVRTTLGEVLLQAHGALDDLLKVATESEHSRVYEVLGQLIKVIAESGEKLINIHKTVEEIRTKEDPDVRASKTVTNNNLFIGTTTQLQAVLEKMRGGRGGNVVEQEEDLW